MLGFHRQAYHLTDHLLKSPPCKKSGFFFPLLRVLCLSFPANRQKELQKAIFPPLCLRQNNEDLLSALPQIPVKVLFLPFAEAVLLPQTHISKFPAEFPDYCCIAAAKFRTLPCVLSTYSEAIFRLLCPHIRFGPPQKRHLFLPVSFASLLFSPSAFSQNKHPAIPPEKYPKTGFWTDRFQKLPLIW